MPDAAYPSLAEQTTPTNTVGTVQVYQDESRTTYGLTPTNAAAIADGVCTYTFLRKFYR